MARSDITLSDDEAMALCLLLAEAADASSLGGRVARHLGQRGPVDDRDIAAESGISHMSVKRIIERSPD